MRRTLILLACSSIALAACGSDGGTASDAGAGAAQATGTPAETSGEAPGETSGETPTETGTPADVGHAEPTDGASGDTQPDGSTDGTSDPADETEPDGSVTDSTVDPPPPTSPDKPTVEIPDELPTELQVTVLAEGEGPEAVAGDTVIVDYVGVRASDGVEFDNSYDRFEPFPVTLGSGSVIKGWDEGLVGVQAGERIQLDIPSDLAYGAEARGDVIGENEALTFVIDVRAVIPEPDPADQPTEAGVPASEGASEVTTVDLIEGEGATLEEGDTAVIQLVLFRGDNLVALDSTWETEPIQIPMNEQGFPGLVEGMPGMKVGGRRAITIPPESGFGPGGSPQIGLPADTDMVIVVDLLGKY
jgi:FKBP-type peptidyl-prolyl cis-trans isomerase